MTACIVGWSHLPFGKHEGEDIEAMIVQVARGALADAGIEAKDVDRIFIGNFNGGFVYQDFPASLVLQADDALRFKPATRLENACATGTAAIHGGLGSIKARDARIALVVGVEKMSEVSGDALGDFADPLGTSHRGTAVFLDDQGHGRAYRQKGLFYLAGPPRSE